jgi:hypothetical protein
LLDRDAGVGLAVLDKRRRGHTLDVEHRRMFRVRRRIVPQLAAEIVGHK